MTTVSWPQTIRPPLTISFLMSWYHLIKIRGPWRMGSLGDSGWEESALGALLDTWLMVAFNLLSLWLLCVVTSAHQSCLILAQFLLWSWPIQLILSFPFLPFPVYTAREKCPVLPDRNTLRRRHETTVHICRVPSLLRYVSNRGNRTPICLSDGSLAFGSSQGSEDGQTIDQSMDEHVKECSPHTDGWVQNNV